MIFKFLEKKEKCAKMEMNQPKKALVTGGTGFLGRNFVQFLLENGWEVVCLVRPTSRYGHLTELGVKIVFGDFFAENALRDAVAGVDCVFHLAAAISAFSFEDMLKTNCTATENLLKACVEQEKKPIFVYVSSLAAAGPSTPERPREEADECRPVSWYGKSKLFSETVLRAYADRIPITVVRPPILFGPFDREVRRWLTAIQKSGIFFIPFLRRFRFSLAHAEDVSSLLLLAAEKGERLPALPLEETERICRILKAEPDRKLSIGILPPDEGRGIYFVSQPETFTYVGLGKLFGNALGRKFTMIIPVSPPLMLVACLLVGCVSKITGKTYALSRDKLREINAGSWSCSADKARTRLGFQNLHTLAEQCESTVEWLRNDQKKKKMK